MKFYFGEVKAKTKLGELQKKKSHGCSNRFKSIGGLKVRLRETMTQLVESLSTHLVTGIIIERLSNIEDH